MAPGDRELTGERGAGSLARADEADRFRDEEREFRRDLRQSRGLAGGLSLVALSIGLREGTAEGYALVALVTVALLALWAVGVWAVAERRAPSRLRALRLRLDLLEGTARGRARITPNEGVAGPVPTPDHGVDLDEAEP